MKIIVLLALLGLGGWIYLKPKTAITDSDIQDFVALTVKSVQSRDSVGFCKHISDDFEMRLTMLQMTDSPTTRMNKAEYCAKLEEGYDAIRKSQMAYNYQFNVKSFLIAPDKKSAALSAETSERMFTPQRTVYSAVSTEEIEIALVKGKVVLTYVKAKTRAAQ